MNGSPALWPWKVLKMEHWKIIALSAMALIWVCGVVFVAWLTAPSSRSSNSGKPYSPPELPKL